MRTLARVLCAICLCLFAGSSMAMDFSKSSNLIVYFSLKHNQGRPDAAQIETNNQHVANTLTTLISADVFELKTVTPYPEHYQTTVNQAREEQAQNARPQLEAIPDVSGYDNIILVYPNWWATYPMAIATFIEAVDLKGKTIIPICTHEGSRLGRSHTDLKNALPQANITEGFAVRGGDVFDSDLEENLKEFLEEL